MTSQSEMDLSCLICYDIFQDPVDLECSHSFCKDCLQRWWSDKQMHMCPICKNPSLLNDPPCNLVLKNQCETLQERKGFLLERRQKALEGSEHLCSLHSEKLKLFCLDHQQPVCVVCRDSKSHNNHKFRPIDEAVQDHRKELQKFQTLLEEKLNLFEEVKGNFDLTAQHIKSQSQHTEKEIKEQFNKFHQFLKEEEKARIDALRKEEEQKTQVIKMNIVDLSRKIAAFKYTIKVAEEELRNAQISFLHNYKAVVEKVEKDLLTKDPQPVPGLLIDVAKHLGNLTFNVWNKMKDMVSYSPLILDPNTAHPDLILSEDLTSVTSGQKQIFPHNPERFEHFLCVLGSEGLNSATHSWDVEVRSDQFWSLGVMKESAKRKGQIQTGYWELSFFDGKLTAVSPPLPDKVLPVEELQKIRVQLDWESGKLSFFDLDKGTLIHTFKHTFAEKMYPYISTKNKLPLKILPRAVSVTQEYAISCGYLKGFWGF
ncbi:nuclear factor 7, ovary-like [Melanotaenia boesemani]|uniref:nuclear factor 7, ovary-like n=1 Tax=Melanotaenia boesemani TaxID=1250792 RepID=UPI001C059BCD|nr:nuclear factor 7, ovary-like [Melanotaenia boesemani]